MPVIARSKAELVRILLSWRREHSGKLPPGTAGGCINDIKYYVSRKLIFVGTSEVVWVDRLLIDKTTIGWILRALDRSCMSATPMTGNNGLWCGYEAWLGGEKWFTRSAVASTDGKPHMPSKLNENPEPVSLGINEDCTTLTSKSTKQKRKIMTVAKQHKPIKLENEVHRYPTQERRLAAFNREFEVWESQGNRGVHTPPQLGVDAASSLQWVPWHPGTSPSAPQTRSKRQSPKLQEAASICSNRTRSPSFEMTSEIRESPRRHGHSASAKSHFSPRKKMVASGRLIAKLPVTPKTPSRRSSSLTITPIPTLSKSKKTSSEALLASLPAASNVIFHFFLSKESLGAIPKLFAQCATPHEFFHEARQAWHILGGPDDGARLLGVKVVIEGVARPIVLLWDSTDGFERMVEAITKEVEGKIDSLNVEVSCIKQE